MNRDIADVTIESDVLVVGGGLAGCRAALRARDLTENVVLVDKGVVGRTGNTIMCHIILAPAPEDAIDKWLQEAVETSEYFCDQEWLETLLVEHPGRLRELMDWGVPLVRDSAGQLVTARCRGMMENCKGVYFAERFWMDHVRRRLMSRGVKLVPRVMITDLLTSDGEHPTSGRITGAVGFDVVTGGFIVFRARAVVIATGPTQPIMPAYGTTSTGDGQAMAFRAGAQMASMEFTPAIGFKAVIRPPSGVGVALARFQNHGAHFVNASGERFLAKYFPERMEQGCGFGLLGQACVREILNGHGPLYFDMRHWSPELYKVFHQSSPDIIARLERAGIDIRRQPLQFRPFTSQFSGQGNGGVHATLGGRASIPGLFVCGTSANAGAAEVFASVSQANCNVFGYRAGESAGREALQQDKGAIHSDQVGTLKEIALRPLKRTGEVLLGQLYQETSRKVLPFEYSLYKHEGRIKDSLNHLDQVEAELLPRVTAVDTHALTKANTVRNYLQMCRLYQVASLERKESRLGHCREEYPYRDDLDWLKVIILKQANEGLTSWTEPIPIERYRIKPKERGRVPAKIRFGS